jgi:hypothetical protein
VACHNVDFVDFDFAMQRGRWHIRNKPCAQLLCHGVHVGGIHTQLRGDLPVRQVQPHEIEAENPNAQRLMMASQNRSCQIIKPSRACLAPIPLPRQLGIVMAISDNGVSATTRTANALRPAMITNERETFSVIQQTRQIDQFRYSHTTNEPLQHARTPSRACSLISPPEPPYKYSEATTPEPNKSQNSLFAGSDEGGENWACMASLIETCKLNEVNPLTYMTELLTRLVNGWPQDRIDELMPWCWKPKPDA